MKDLIPILIGASITFLSVLFTLRHNQKLHEQALREEREKAKEEREFQAKQDALLGASEAICRFIDYFGRIPDIALEGGGKSVPESVNMGIALNKLHFYCTLPTITAVTKLGNSLNTALCAVLAAKVPAELERSKTQGIDVRIKGLEKSAASVEANNLALLASNPNSPIIEHNHKQLADIHGESADFWRQKDEVFRSQTQLTEKCRDVMASHLPQIYKALRDILLLARDELSFDIEKEEYLKLMEESTQKVLSELQVTFDTIRNQINEAAATSEA